MAANGVRSFLDGRVLLHACDCRDAIRELADASIDAAVMDPPYALVSIGKRFGKTGAAPAKQGTDGLYARASAGFMGQQWDTGETAFAVEFWAEVLRVLKPGGHLVAFSGTRTYHRMAVAIEDAGFEIRDQLGWAYGSGFPKSHDVAKGIARRRVEDVEPIRAVCRFVRRAMDAHGLKSADLTAYFDDCNPRLIDHWAARDTDSQPSLPTADQWLILKAVLALGDQMDIEFDRLNRRKGQPGAAWADAEIVGSFDGVPGGFGDHRFSVRDDSIRSLDGVAADWSGWGTALKPAWEPIVLARKPLDGTVAENVLTHGPGALNIAGCRVPVDPAVDSTQFRTMQRGARVADGWGMGATSGAAVVRVEGRWPANILHDGSDEVGDVLGEASRFFYSAKADADDRIGSKHPTVKPVDLMRWLCRLVTPPGGMILDAFAGTGTTGEAAFREGFSATLIEREPQFQADIARRMELVLAGPMTRKTQSIKARGTALPAGGLFTELTEAVE